MCENETGYDEGGRRHEPWWRQTAQRGHLRAIIEISWRQLGRGGSNAAVVVRSVGRMRRFIRHRAKGDREKLMAREAGIFLHTGMETDDAQVGG